MNKQEPIFACNISALNKDERARYSVLTKQLIADKKEVEELPDGYLLRFAANSRSIKDVAEFITYERACCPFFDFDMSVSGDSVALKLVGPEGVKPFIKDEFGI